MATLTGKTLGKYRIIERMGRGGMAEVYRAYHPRLDRYVAVKVLHGYLAEDEAFLERFEREARAVAALRHPHIVQVYDSDVEDDYYFMIMEYIDGFNLKEKMGLLASQNIPIPLDEISNIIQEICAALDYAHQQGMIHRDIKPANILIDETGRSYLTDFGIAHIISDTHITSTGALLGTPDYMSPEQCQGLRATKASDIYSLGVVLYEIITGRVPFDADTPLAVLNKHIHDPLPIPHEIRPDIPESLERVVLKAMAKDPDDRYQTAAKMAQAVAEAVASTPTQTITIPDISYEQTLKMEPAHPTIPAAETPLPEAPAERDAGYLPHHTPEEKGKKTPKSGRKYKTIIIIALSIVGVLAIAAIAAGLVITNLSVENEPQVPECNSIEACAQQTEELLAQDDFEGAIRSLDQGIGIAEGLEHPPHAFLWCHRGEISMAMGALEEAHFSFINCIEWTEDDPDLQPMRDFAMEQIEMIEREFQSRE